VVAHYEDEARRVGVARVIEELVHLVTRLALVEETPETDALEHAEALGDGVEWVDDAGRVAQAAGQSRGEAAQSTVQWHALGTVHPERVTCPVCRAVSDADADSGEVPTCAGCGSRSRSCSIWTALKSHRCPRPTTAKDSVGRSARASLPK
jgi:hypothetical protein